MNKLKGTFIIKRDRRSYLILTTFIILFGLRLVHISADPPTNLSFSGGLFFDEGLYVHNARNKILFGEWKLDEWNDFYYSPVLTYIKWAVFSVFRVGLAQERLVSVVFSCLTLWVLYLALKVTLRRSTAILGVFLLGFNYIYLMYSRIGLLDTPVLLPTVLTLCFWQLGTGKDNLQRGHWYMFLAGVSCFTVYIFKALLIYFLPVPVVSIIFLWLISDNHTERRRLLRLMGFFLGGMIITMILWFIVFYYPNYEAIRQISNYIMKAQAFPHSFRDLLDCIISTPFLLIFSKTPVILILAIGYLLYLLYLTIHNRSQLEPVDVFMSLWFIAHVLFFLGYGYRPTRYYNPIIPPMSILAARGIIRMTKIKSSYKITTWFWGFWWLVLCLLWVNILFHLYGFRIKLFALQFPVTVPHSIFFGMLLLGVTLSFVIILLIAWMIRKHRENRLQISHRTLVGIAIATLLLSVSINGIQYYRWVSDPQYEIRDISKKLGTLPEGTFIAGLSAPTLCLETIHRPLFLWKNFVNYQDTLRKYALTHLFLGKFNREVEHYQRNFPELMERAILVKTYWIKGAEFLLYSVTDPSK